MQIQVDIPEEINKKLKIERIQKGYDNKQELIIKILEDYFNG